MSRHFTIVVTQENRLRFAFLRKEHGLLHDRREKKSYAVVREAYPTNWVGKWARAYLVYEDLAQSVQLTGDAAPEGDAAAPAGSTVEIKQPLNMLARIKLPGRRGDDGETRETWLTAESIYDRTMSAQVRRLGNRRIQWFHALLFVSLGIAVCLALTAAILMLKGAGSSSDAADAALRPAAPRGAILAPTPAVPETPVVIVGGGRAEERQEPAPPPEAGP